ncbi:hypothetical protein [Pukyongiella litopenaei]|uniref:Uncharacterized protein n=1 Tax=Pukyongiella litopenaei TaxID=2605946 RepID=A0A2S0MNP9_9RHOB|nr:hypothetical protein [Pukyongiella litopenaei]AVO37522.2 hypothetical protein C6Y53_07245 [Pukyongiella litopenaei]
MTGFWYLGLATCSIDPKVGAAHLRFGARDKATIVEHMDEAVSNIFDAVAQACDLLAPQVYWNHC